MESFLENKNQIQNIQINENEIEKLKEIKKNDENDKKYDFKIKLDHILYSKLVYIATLNDKGKTKKDMQELLNEMVNELIEEKFREVC